MSWKTGYEWDLARVKLFKKGFSHEDINTIFETLDSPEDIHNLGKVVDKCEELVLMPEYKKYLGLIDEMCKFLVANEDQEICRITALKKCGKWTFTVGVH